MRIILLGTAYPMRGGIAHANASLYKSLSKSHQVLVLSFKRQYPGVFFPGRTQIEPEAPGIPIPATPMMDTINPFSWFKSAWYTRRFRPDLMIFNYFMPFFAPTFATISCLSRLFTNTKVVFICHNIVPHEKKPFDTVLSQLALKFVDFFVVLSDAVRDDLLAIRPTATWKKCQHPVYDIFPNTVDKNMARQQLGYRINENLILFFGFIRRYKGVTNLLQAFAQMVPELPAKLMLVGECYEGREEILNLVTALHLAPFVNIIDQYIPNDKVQLYFQAADVVVLPYIAATQSGITQIAYHFNKPVITTDVGGLAEAIIDGVTGFIVPPDDIQALSKSINTFFIENYGPTMSKNIAENIHKATWDEMAQTITSFLEK